MLSGKENSNDAGSTDQSLAVRCLVDGDMIIIRSGKFGMIDLPRNHDPRGDLTFVEGSKHIPFDIRRVYYLYNVPVDAERGGHAHRELEQVIFALSGSFRIKIDDGSSKSEYWLRDPRKGLYVSRLIWREMDSFSQGAVCMVLASHCYDEADYYRDYNDFLGATRASAQVGR